MLMIFKNIFILFLFVVFFVGAYLYSIGELTEAFNPIDLGSSSSSCPDMLINTGDVLLLYNSKLPEEAGINPLPLYNLDEYINYVNMQKKKGINCPVLYLQKESNAQGQDVYNIRDNPFNPQNNNVIVSLPKKQVMMNFPPSLLANNSSPENPVKIGDASRQDPPYNKGMYAGYDPLDLYIGQYTDLDALHDSTERNARISDNPMDSNWGGVMHTQRAIESGKYDENNVSILVA